MAAKCSLWLRSKKQPVLKYYYNDNWFRDCMLLLFSHIFHLSAMQCLLDNRYCVNWIFFQMVDSGGQIHCTLKLKKQINKIKGDCAENEKPYSTHPSNKIQITAHQCFDGVRCCFSLMHICTTCLSALRSDYFKNIWLQSRREIKATRPPSELLLALNSAPAAP